MKTSTRRNTDPTVVSAVVKHGMAGVPAVYRRKTRRNTANWLQLRYAVPVVMCVNTLWKWSMMSGQW